MTQQPLFIPVRGMTPRPAIPADLPASIKLTDWRQFIVRKAQSRYNKSAIQGITSQTRFTVDMVFLLTQAEFGKDLDNLAKAVLDSLFKENYQVKGKGIGAALFDIDDVNVVKLTLEKIIVSEQADEGVDITITWM
jgi:hypothetical protein